MTKILMVCLGNICRSPLAEGILRAKVDSAKVMVDSAGTADYHVGNPPDPRSIAVAQTHGIAIAKQRCRVFTSQDFIDFDRIYVMDKSNYANVLALAETQADRDKVQLLLGANQEVPDPYYGGDDGFAKVYNLIDAACDQIIKTL